MEYAKQARSGVNMIFLYITHVFSYSEICHLIEKSKAYRYAVCYH